MADSNRPSPAELLAQLQHLAYTRPDDYQLVLNALDNKRTATSANLPDRPDATKIQRTLQRPWLEEAIPRSSMPILPTEHYSFENRERELQQYIAVLNHNWGISPLMENTSKFRLALASQMVGSGKTWFGANILLSAFKHRRKLRKMISEEHNSKFDSFLSAQYVYINMKKCGNTSLSAIPGFVLETLIEQCFKKNPEWNCDDVIQQATEKFKTSDRLQPMIKWFQETLQCPLFLHFDEVDFIAANKMVGPEKALQPSPTLLEPFYNFWIFIYPLLETSYLYCSGRSPILFLLGRQLFKEIFQSPDDVTHFFFDRLQHKNICNMINKLVKEAKLTVDDTEKVAEQVMDFTAGVPRLVTYTLNYLILLKTISKDTFTGTFAKQLFDYTVQNGGREELTGWSSLTGDSFTLYTQFVYDAILGVPYSPKELLSSPTSKLDKVSVLQAVWALGLYTAKTPQYKITEGHSESLLPNETPDSLIYLIVPPITAYALSRECGTEAIIYSAMIDMMLAKQMYTPKGEMLERVAVLCLRLRIDSKIKLHDHKSAVNIFPFLASSSFARLEITTSRPDTYSLPKFTHKRGSWQDNQLIVEKLVNIKFTDSKTNKYPDISPSKQIQITDWRHVLPLLQTGQYAPADISTSGDYYIYFSSKIDGIPKYYMLVFQFKAGSKEYPASQVNAEIYKSFDMRWLASAEGQQKLEGIVLVFVGGNFKLPTAAYKPLNNFASEILPNNLLEPENGNNQTPATYSNWPHQLQVLHLTVEGEKQFLSPFNISYLH